MMSNVKRLTFTNHLLITALLVSLAVALLLGAMASANNNRAGRQSRATATAIVHDRVAPVVERLSGSSAIDTSVAVSAKYYDANTAVAYIVNRNAYPDGVVASSMKTTGPVLYIDSTLPASVASELQRLQPQKVVAVGGTSVVSETALDQIRQNVPATTVVQRLSGPDRYSTAVSVSQADYPQGSDLIYVTNGFAYADSIIATQQSTQAPLLYVSNNYIPPASLAEMIRLNPSQIVVIGGTSVVSDSVTQTIAQQTGATVKRLSGSSRISTAVSLSQDTYPDGVDRVFLTDGWAYADSILVGSIPVQGSMLYVSGSLSAETMTEIQRLRATTTTVIGGTARVSPDVVNKTQQIMTGGQVANRLAPGVSYFVLAHPDDEIAAWAAIDNSSYPVFVLTTQGENSGYCVNHGGKGSQQCKDKRVGSFHQFLDNYYSVSDHGMQPGGFHLYKGDDSARLIFDFGDGNLTTAEVTSAINAARQIDFDGRPENYVAAGAYWNIGRDPRCDPTKSDYACGHYDHTDHRTVSQTVTNYSYQNRLTVHGSHNPTINASIDMGQSTFNSMIACPNGTYNQAYSWLRPPCWTTDNSHFQQWTWVREY